MKKYLVIFKLLICACICVNILSSCYSITVPEFSQRDITVDDFPAFRKNVVGVSYNQIVTKMGAPQRREPDGAGGNILIYENTTTKTISNTLAKAYNVNIFTGTYTPGAETTTRYINQTDYIQFYVNANNVCYDVRTNIPMTHTEKSAPYKSTYEKIHWGKTLGKWSGWYAVLPAILGIMLAVGPR